MHKRNIALTALVLAAIIAGSFFVYHKLSHFAFLRGLYAPAILLSILLSGSSHSPSAVTVWVNFVIFTLVYWFIIWIFIAFISELLMIRRGFHHLEDVEDHGTAGKAGTKKFPQQAAQAVVSHQQEGVEDYDAAVETEAKMYLEKFGKALKDVEGRRRKNFLLQNMDFLDLKESDELLAAHAISKAANERPVKVLLKQLESTLAAKKGSREAAIDFMERLKQKAKQKVDNLDATPKGAPTK